VVPAFFVREIRLDRHLLLSSRSISISRCCVDGIVSPSLVMRVSAVVQPRQPRGHLAGVQPVRGLIGTGLPRGNRPTSQTKCLFDQLGLPWAQGVQIAPPKSSLILRESILHSHVFPCFRALECAKTVSKTPSIWPDCVNGIDTRIARVCITLSYLTAKLAGGLVWPATVRVSETASPGATPEGTVKFTW